MTKSKRGTNPNTRKAVAVANLRRKVDRLRNELATIAREDSDRLLAQSPVCLKIIHYLQGIKDDEALELAEELHTLLVEQAFQESIAEGVIQIGDSYIT